jgi:hypothetical protein
MIPRTFPSTYASNGQQQMVVYFLTSIAGLQRWADYIPVKLAQGGVENSYNNNGYMDVTVVSYPTATQQAWKEYIPVYLDDSATDAWLVNSVGYIPYGYALFSDASMIMDMTNTGALDSRVTFSRTTNATLTDSTGTLVYAPHNLLVQSESFDSSSWAKTRATITANTTTAPDGTTTADKLVEQTDVATNRSAGQTVAVISGFQYTFSVYVQAAERTQINLRFSSGFAAGNTFFTLTGSGSATNAGIVDSSSITNVGGGWYRCTFTQTATSSVSAAAQVFLASGGAITYDGVAGNGLFLWGAQLNVGTLQPYYPTTVRNALGFTQEFDNAAWSKTSTTITANATTAPDKSLTADKFIPDLSTNGGNIRSPLISKPTSVTPYAYSCYAKAGEFSSIILYFNDGASTANRCQATYNLSSGTTSSVTNVGTFTGASASMVPVGDGWYRCLLLATTSTEASVQARIVNPSTGQTGDGTSGIFVWGAQLSDSASLDEYRYNPAAAITSTAYYGPRFDYDPVTLAARGLLVEEQRTNNLLYSSEFDNAGWSKSNATITANATAAPDGSVTADTFTGAAGTSIKRIRQNVTTTALGPWTYSIWLKNDTAVSALVALLDSSVGGVNNVRTTLTFSTGSVSTAVAAGTATGASASVTPFGNGWYRVSITGTFVTALTSVWAEVWLDGFTSTASETSFYVWGAMLESGSFQTSYIPTTTAAATRAADICTMVGDNFGNWFNAVEGTLFAEYAKSNNAIAGRALTLNNGTANNQIRINASLSTNIRPDWQILDGGVVQANVLGAVEIAVNVVGKTAGAYRVNDFQQATNGTLGVADTSGTVPTISQANIGANEAGLASINGHIRRIAFINRRVSNAELQALTA